MVSLFTEWLYGFSVYRVFVWFLGLQSCCKPIQQLCKQRTHTTTLKTENPYNNSVNLEPIQQLYMGSQFTEFLYGFSVYRVVVWVLCLQSCCMGSRFTELLYGFSVYRVGVWVKEGSRISYKG
jgi:hypothetical protein